MIPVAIKRKAPGEGPPATSEHDDPLALLEACHQRIRKFVAITRRLGGPAGAAATPRDVLETATSTARYFDEALPLHAADEDLSLRPRLERLPHPGDELARALDQMTAEHAPIEDLARQIVGVLGRVIADPTGLATQAPELARLGAEIERLFELHLEPEERIIFPATRTLLDGAELAALLAEMRARRAD